MIALDQLSKFVVRSTIPLYAKRTIVPHLLDFTHVQNTGAAFGVLNAADFPLKSAVMIAIATLALVAISLYARQLGNDERLSRYGLALILGGAFGNLIDRALGQVRRRLRGRVWGDAQFWAFNVADAAITIGAILVLLEMLGVGRRRYQPCLIPKHDRRGSAGSGRSAAGCVPHERACRPFALAGPSRS